MFIISYNQNRLTMKCSEAITKYADGGVCFRIPLLVSIQSWIRLWISKGSVRLYREKRPVSRRTKKYVIDSPSMTYTDHAFKISLPHTRGCASRFCFAFNVHVGIRDGTLNKYYRRSWKLTKHRSIAMQNPVGNIFGKNIFGYWRGAGITFGIEVN